MIYEPGSPQDIEDATGKLKLNLWTGWGVEPKRGDWSLMRTHIREVLAAGDDAVDTYIMNWLAWRVQHPDRRQEAALAFLGKPGSGRGTLGVAMCRIFGNHALHLSSPDHLVGRFNWHQRQCSFVFADEAYTVEDRDAAGRLKRLITEPTLQIEGKNRDPGPVQNRLGVMMASNEERVIPAGEWERRYVAQRVSNDHAQDTAWFEPLYKQLNPQRGAGRTVEGLIMTDKPDKSDLALAIYTLGFCDGVDYSRDKWEARLDKFHEKCCADFRPLDEKF